MRQTPPAPADSLRAAPFPQPRAEKLSVHLAGDRGGSRGPAALLLGRLGYLAVLVLSRKRTCVRVLSECMGLCMSACRCVCVSFPAPWLFRFRPRSCVRTPSSSQSRFSRRGKVLSKVRTCGRPEFLHPAGPITHPASPAPLLPLAGLLLQRAYFLAAGEL